MGLLCGTGKVPITPLKPIKLGGYLGRSKESEGVLSDILVQVIYLKSDCVSFLFISYDLLGIDDNFGSIIKGHVNNITGLDKNNILITAIHTHSGPEGYPGNIREGLITDKPYINEEYKDYLIEQTIKCVNKAKLDLVQVEAYFSEGRTDGLYSNRIDRNALYDNEILTVRFGTEGITKACIINLSCHPTVLGSDNTKISSDFAGFMRDSVSAKLNRCEVLFINGSAGDVSTRFTRRSQDIEEAKYIGTRLGTVISEIFNNEEKIDIDYFKRENFQFTYKVDREIKKPDGTGLEGHKITGGYVTVYASIIDLGEMRIAAFSGEPFSSIGLNIKAHSSKKTMIAGYAEGYSSYILDRDGYEHDSYESLVTLLPRGASEEMLEKIINYMKGEDK